MLATALLTIITSLPHTPPATLPPWNDTGHRLVALIAWDELAANVALRTKIVELLKKHPNFDRDFHGRMPPIVRDGSNFVQDRWIFLQAAVWPDIARGYRGKEKEKFDRPKWHYINEPIYLSADEREAIEPSVRSRVNLAKLPPEDGRKRRSMNAVQALEHAVREIKGAAEDADKAVSLCWLFHLVGDVHQPMHSTSLFTAVRFPSGDRGGNSIRVTGGNLHSVWDGALGRATSVRSLQRTARRIRSESGDVMALAADKLRFEGWVTEGYDLARNHAYSEEILATVEAAEDEKEADLPPTKLTTEYYDQMKGVAATRVLEAGARLAAILSGLRLVR